MQEIGNGTKFKKSKKSRKLKKKKIGNPKFQEMEKVGIQTKE